MHFGTLLSTTKNHFKFLSLPSSTILNALKQLSFGLFCFLGMSTMCSLCVHPVSAPHLFAILNFKHYPVFHSRYLCYPKIKKEISMKLFGLDVDGNEKEFDLKNFTGQKVILIFTRKIIPRAVVGKPVIFGII